MNPKRAALVGLMPKRVRIRRESKGISGADLARKVDVSPAYVSQIEKGIRVPDIPVAVRIAHALDDDEALYVAWSRDHKARSRSKTPSTGDDDAWTQRYRSDRFDDDESFHRNVGSGEDITPSPQARMVSVHAMRSATLPTMSVPLFDSSTAPPGAVERVARAHVAQARSEGRELVTAPVLEPGKDPGERDEIPRQLQVDTMVIDPRFVPEARLDRPFVFRADAEVSRRVQDRVAVGDLVILSRALPDGAPETGRIYALRHGGRVFLGRLARFGEKFLVQPGPGETEMVDVGLVAGGPAKPAVVGEVVAVIKGG
jgi:transcriptional regulator with XRE-family HTH domain